MAITFDAVGTGDANAGYSHTCTGSNLVLFVGILSDGTISGCTYNSVAMTLVNSVLGTPAGNNEYLFFLSNPATGTHTIQATGSTATRLGDSTSYAGVSQTGQPEQNNTGTGTTSVTVSVTTTSDNAWLVGYGRNGAGNLSPGTNTTARGAAAPQQMFDTNSAQTPAGSHSLQITAAGSQTALMIASVAPFAVAPVVSGRVEDFMLMRN